MTLVQTSLIIAGLSVRIMIAEAPNIRAFFTCTWKEEEISEHETKLQYKLGKFDEIRVCYITNIQKFNQQYYDNFNTV